MVDPSLYTHLEFKVRTAPGRGLFNRGLSVTGAKTDWNDIDSVKWPSVDAENPWYTNDSPFGDAKVRFPRPPLTRVARL